MMKILMAPIKGIKGAGPRDSVKQGPVFSDARRCNNLEQIAVGIILGSGMKRMKIRLSGSKN